MAYDGYGCLRVRVVDAADLPTVDGLLAEADCFNRAVATPAARERMAAFLAAGGQTRAVELALGTTLGAFADG